jgi:hypothetical protein
MPRVYKPLLTGADSDAAVSLITCGEASRIVEFRVMLRPLQAVNLVHQKMADLLAER